MRLKTHVGLSGHVDTVSALNHALTANATDSPHAGAASAVLNTVAINTGHTPNR